MRRALAIAGLVLVAAGKASAQSSASYKLGEYAVNAAGRPASGQIASSASYRVTLDAVGDAAAAAGVASASYRADSGFVPLDPPPGEVRGVRWTGKTVLAWDPEKSIGTYNAYKDALATFPGNYGVCLATALVAESVSDPATPALGTGWFYLVTAENRLLEEGTKGNRSNGAERPNPAPCP